MGIPAFAESKTGYFTTIEVETVLNLLAVLDNPMQDIPLTAVLRSPDVYKRQLPDRRRKNVTSVYHRRLRRRKDQEIIRKSDREGHGLSLIHI